MGAGQVLICTLGRFDIQDSEGNLLGSLNRANIIWKLLKFLIVNRGRDIPSEVILTSLYPHENFENPKGNIQNMVYRLRKSLDGYGVVKEGTPIIVVSNGCYRLDIGDTIILDNDLFEDYIKKARIIKSQDPEQAITLYLKALELYQGSFLPDLLYEDWVIPERNHYEKLYLQGIQELLQLYSRLDRLDEMIDLCEKAILIERYEESIHICYMKCLLKKGKPRDAQHHYEQTTDFFYRQFGIKPSPDMQQIYHEIRTAGSVRKGEEGNVVPIWENNKGAFFCEQNVFRSIYMLEKRRSERSGKPVCAVSIDFKGKTKPHTRVHEKALASFQNILTASLRKGDVVSVNKDSTFLILLPELDFDKTKFVLKRITGQFLEKQEFQQMDFNIKAVSISELEL